MSEKLEPCPFCGSDDVFVVEHHFYKTEDCFGVQCDNCKTQSYQFYDSKNEAIEAWNRRAKND